MTELFPQSSKVFTVAELTRQIRGTLETKFGSVWVQGEISNYKLHPSGHQYFTLKDQRAQISCVIWRDTMAPPRQSLVDGTQVQVYGTVTVFEARGQYQLNVQILQPRGVGLLQAKFEALKRKLEAEGLFAPERKRPLPKFPRRIGIVTSPSGAAIRDMLNVLRRRAPWLQILISPVRVQGTGAAQEIAVAIRELAMPNEAFAPARSRRRHARRRKHRRFVGVQRRDCRPRNISFRNPNRLRGRSRNRFYHLRFRRRFARADTERCRGINCARHYRSPATD